jgi:hypothetical protein
VINTHDEPGLDTPRALDVRSYIAMDMRSYADNGLGSMAPGAPITLNHSLVTGNTAAHGGGIFNSSGTVTLSASNVTGNHPDDCEPPGTIAGCVG